MQNDMMEKLKKIIEDKKEASAKQGYKKVVEGKQKNGARKAIKNKKTGGALDK